MEELRHRNDIEIKLLPNRRYIYSNRRSNIVITAEHRATEITVVFPDEYEEYSKRVDFVNSQGKEWTEGLYCPEYLSADRHGEPPDKNKKKGGGHSGSGDQGENNRHGNRNGGETPCRFHFTLPSEVTTTGELKMQFLAYLPNETMTTVPFEIVTIDVQEGVLAFKKNARSNPDLLILSYNRSTQALFNGEQAKAKSEKAETQSKQAAEKANETAADLAAETVAREQADAGLRTAIEEETAERIEAVAAERAVREQADAELTALLAVETERATQAETEITAALNDETAERTAALEVEAGARIAGDEANGQAIAAEADARIQADAELSAAVNAETARARAEEADLRASLGVESDRARAAEQSNEQRLTAEIGRAAAEETAIAAGLASETERAANAENALAEGIAAEQNRALTAEQNILVSVDGERAEREQADAGLTAALNAEAAARMETDGAEQAARIAGDEANAAAVQAEAQRAQSAESAIAADLSAESQRAQGAESAVAADLAGEVSRALTAEGITAVAVEAERTRAQGTETENATAIANETQRAQNAESNLQSAIEAETARASGAEAGITAAVTAEAVRAQTQEQLNASAITVETERAAQAETALGARLDTEIPAAVSQANAYADQVAEQVRIDGTVYKGTVEESELPTSEQTHGDLYWISEFNITNPEHAGSAIWNGATGAWDFSVDRYKHEDNDTIVPRASDGALRVADVEEANLTADAADFGASVGLGFKAFIRSVVRKIKGLFQRTAQNETAITTEVGRAQTAEGGLFSNLASEASRAQSAEQVNANAVQSEAQRAQTAENGVSASIAAETARAQTAEQANASGITAETARAQSAESGLSSAIATETARAQGAENGLAANITAEQTRAQNAENNLSGSIAAEASRATTAEQANANALSAETARALSAEQSNANAVAAETSRAISSENGKVDKLAGKGLSTNDYSTADKNKLAGIAAGAQVNEVTEAPNDGKRYARKNGEWSEVEASGGTALPDTVMKFRGEWASGTAYAKNDVVTQTNGLYVTNYLSLADGNTATYTDAAKWKNLSVYAYVAQNVTVMQSANAKKYLLGSSNLSVTNASLSGNPSAYVDTDNCLYDARGKLAAQSEIPSGGGGTTDDTKLPLTGGELTGNLTLKYPSKLRGGGNGQQDSDWLAYDNSSNYFTVGNTGTVTEIASAGTCAYRKNGSGARYKIYDEGNKPAPSAIGAASTNDITDTARMSRFEDKGGVTNITTAGQTVSAGINTTYAKALLGLSNTAQSSFIYVEVFLRSDEIPVVTPVPGIGGYFASGANPLNLVITATRTSTTAVQFKFDLVTYSGGAVTPNFVLHGIMAIK